MVFSNFMNLLSFFLLNLVLVSILMILYHILISIKFFNLVMFIIDAPMPN